MITTEEYYSALRIVNDYLSQTGEFSHAKLIGIHDNHHDYSHLEIGKIYEIKKWIPPRRISQYMYNAEFIIYINGKRHLFKSFSNMMTWEFIKK
jgi:hypothetical protein